MIKKVSVRHGLGWFAACAMVGLIFPALSFAETRGFVIYYLHPATHGDKQNCPDGTNGDYGEIKRTAFKLHGFSQEKIDRIVAGEISPMGTEMRKITSTRGRRNGKPAIVFHYPTSAPEPKIKMVVGPYAYGFDLDGVGAESPKAFEDPETGQKGIDNELYRLVGCFNGYNESLPVRPNYEQQIWTLWGYKMPAWLFTISGKDLSRDGEVEVSFYKAVGHRRQNARGDTLVNATYVIDPNPANQGKFRGRLTNGVFTSAPDNNHIIMKGDPDYGLPAKFELLEPRLRLNLNADGSASGYVGGYQPWMDFWFMQALTNETTALNTVALYYNLRRMADAHPDPVTGKNTAISATYRIDSAAAYIARPDGTLLTDSY